MEGFRRSLKTVLLIEDSETLRRFLTDFFSSLNLNVFQASDGEDPTLIVRYHRGTIDLLLKDVNLGLGSKPECAIETARRYPRSHILFMSGGLAQEAWDGHPDKPQGSYFIAKPSRLRRC
jgi:DNA-binding response OmpR family regulator